MMKWKARKETLDIGVLELGNLTLDEDYMEVSIDICGISEELKAELNKAIEIRKIEFVEERIRITAENGSAHPKKRNLTWSDQPVIMDFTYLKVSLEAGKPIEYSIEFGFHDAVDEYMEAWGGSLTVDLSAYTKELKKAIIHVLIDRFF